MTGDELMKKLLIIAAVFFIILFNTSIVHSSNLLSEKDLVSICNEVYDALMTNEAALAGKSYIVVNINSDPIKNLSESSKQQILNNMKKYEINHINIIASSMEGLKAKGLVDVNNALNINGIRGVYLYISSIDVKQKDIVSVVGSWFSDPGSAGDLRLTFKNERGTWKVIESH